MEKKTSLSYVQIKALVLTGDSCPTRVLKICFKVAPFREGGGIGFPA